ncbi:nonstructural protein 1 [Bocaparvovirus lagomorph1]|uniref:Initiator protein NS1 n=1 Tax=Bocaparvovirus lagomorph1 TaxID=3052037 RepID=A0A0U3BDC2_9VIRU|nr:nonstructural protein 1 [Bocaparvovirus lagomorph1]ALT04901.1 nonstructural protein 1 [Bocaparvovirus lagomorph1]
MSGENQWNFENNGDFRPHVHCIVSGKGLTRFTAKSMRLDVEKRWIACLVMAAKQTGLAELPEEQGPWKVLVRELDMAADEVLDGRMHCSRILQYRSRAGQYHALRVDAREFITNYFLPKNLLWNRQLSVNQATPGNSWFQQSYKCYALSYINEKFISYWRRRHLYERLANSVLTRTQSEPVASGSETVSLPEVSVQRFKLDKEPDPEQRMNKKQAMMLDAVQRSTHNHWLTYEDMVRGAPELLIMLESQPGGNKLIEQLLQMVHISITQKYTALEYILARHPMTQPDQLSPDNKIVQLLNFQGYNAWQTGHWLCVWLSKRANKQNTISFFGPASTGKTNLAKSVVNCVKLYGCVNHLNKNFVFNDCAAKLVLWWEECLMTTDWVEPAKCILGGTETRIDRKHRESQLLPHTPVIISTNNDIYTVVGGNVTHGVHATPLRARIVQFNLMKMLPQTFGEITTEECAAWLTACYARFKDHISLQGFCDIWRLKQVPHSFPNQSLCPSHTQDFVLHEHGLCLSCGGYLPLRRSPEPEPVQQASHVDWDEIDARWLGELPTMDAWSPDTQDWDWLDSESTLSAPDSPSLLSGRPSGRQSPDTATPDPTPPARPNTPVEPGEPDQQVPIIDLTGTDVSSDDETDCDEEAARVAASRLRELAEQLNNEFASQPVSEEDIRRYDRLQDELGIIRQQGEQGEPQEPIVLHCFETIPDSPAEEGDPQA